MGFFYQKKIPPIHLEKVGELPPLPTFDVPEMETPTLAKYQSLTKEKYTPITALSNALLGTDIHEFFKDNLSPKKNERPEETEARKALREKYFATIHHMYDVANTFTDRLQSTDGIFSIFMKQIEGVHNQIVDKVQNSPSTGKRKGGDDAAVTDMLAHIKDIKTLFTEKITRAYEVQKQELEQSLGEENQNSSYGLWKKSYLENAYVNRLLESDYEIMTKYSGVVLDRALQQLELSAKPLLMQMNLMQQAVSTDLETQKLEEEKFVHDRDYELKLGSLELQRKGELLKGLQAQEQLNLEKQRLQGEQITQQNLALIKEEEERNKMAMANSELRFKKAVNDIETQKYYDQMAFQKAAQERQDMMQKIAINNEARYKEHMVNNAPPKPSLLGKTVSNIVGIGGGLALSKGFGALGSLLKL